MIAPRNHRIWLRRFARAEQGAAAVELVFVLFLLTIPILNVVDLAFYAFTWMQTQNAAQMGAQAAFSNCYTANTLPAATKCYGPNTANNMTLYDVVYEGIQGTALNNTVTLVGSQVSDGYYCSTTGSVLTQIGTLGYAYADNGTLYGALNATPSGSNSPPAGGVASCSVSSNTFADGNAAPGEYVRVSVTHSYQSIFPWVSVASLLPATMSATAYARIS